MYKPQKSLLFFFILVLLTFSACSAYSRYSGVDGESSSANHDQWTNVLPDADAEAEAADSADPMEEAESSDTSGSTEDIHIDPSLQQTELSRFIESGDILIEMIESNGGGTQGEILEVVITNQSGEEIVVEIPPGLVFSPIGSDEQNLMVLDGEVVTLQPGETIVFSPYVICIEPDAAAPSTSSAYQIGYLESGDLLAFAQCVDEQAGGTLDQDDIGLQFAAWSIAQGGNIFEMPDLTEEEEGALSGLMEEWEAIPGMLEMMQEMASNISTDWLQRCNITLEGEE